MNRFLVVATAAMLATASGGVAVAASHPGHRESSPRRDGHARAVAEASRILRDAPVLAGSKRHKSAPSKLLGRPPSSPGDDGLVTRSRYWITTVGAKQALHRLTASPPSGFRNQGSGSIGDRDMVTLRFVDDSLRHLPGDIAYGDLLIAVSSLKDGKTGIGAYAETVPQPPRPSGEDVPASVTSVALSWTVSYSDRHPLARTIAGTQARRFVAAFNAMKVSTSGPIACPLSFGDLQSATFVGDGHTWVARTDDCGGIDVVRDGKALAELAESSAYDTHMRHALGLDAPPRKPAESVPGSVRSVTVTRTSSAGTTSRTVHRSRAAGLVTGFDDLAAIRPGVQSCTATGTTFTVTFGGEANRWVAAMDPCHLIAVARDDKAQPPLVDDGEWSQLVTQALRH